jgi:hypothetical protein
MDMQPCSTHHFTLLLCRLHLAEIGLSIWQQSKLLCLVPLLNSSALFNLSRVARDRISPEPIRSRMKPNVSDLRLIANWFLLSPATLDPAWLSPGDYPFQSNVHGAIITPCPFICSIYQHSNAIVTTLSRRSENYKGRVKTTYVTCQYSEIWVSKSKWELDPVPKPHIIQTHSPSIAIDWLGILCIRGGGGLGSILVSEAGDP